MVVGDDGTITFTGGKLLSVITINPAFGGNDSVTIGNGPDIVIGGIADDTIKIGNGDNIVVGDNGAGDLLDPRRAADDRQLQSGRPRQRLDHAGQRQQLRHWRDRP